MDQIINDKYYDKATNFIQEHITSEILTDEVRNKFTEYYQSLTMENAKYVFDEVSKLYNEAVQVNRHEFMSMQLKFAGTIFLYGGGISLIGMVGKKLIPEKSNFHKYAEYVQNGGLCVVGLSVIMLFAIGH